jgi:hypothetical protein
MKRDYGYKRTSPLKGSVDRYHLVRDGELPGQIRTSEKEKKHTVHQCERCPVFILKGIYCKPCSEDVRAESQRSYNKSFK